MPETRYSTIANISFEEAVDRLSQQTAVSGLIIIGSASQNRLNPASDYDLVMIKRYVS